MHSSLIIPGPFFILGVVANQVGSLSVDPKDANVHKTSGRKNVIVITRITCNGKNTITVESNIKNKGAEELKRGINSTIRNKKAEELKEDAKVGLKV